MDYLTQERPRLSRGVILRREDAGHNRGRWVIRAPGGRCFATGDLEAAFLALMDGTRTWDELSRAAVLKVPGLDGAGAAEFVRQLARVGLMEEDGAPPVSRPLLTARLVTADAGSLLLPFCRVLRRVPVQVGAVGLAVLAIAGAAGIAAHRDHIAGAFAALFVAILAHPERLVLLAMAVWLLGLGHEAAHAVAALVAGCPAASLGVAAAPRRLIFFCEIPGLALLPVHDRVWIAASGPLWDAAAGMGALLLTGIWPAHREVAALLAAASLLRAIWNLAPMPHTDGAYMLTQLARTLRRARGSAVQRR